MKRSMGRRCSRPIRAPGRSWRSGSAWFNCYVYPNTIRAYALQYVIPRGEDGKPDRNAIDEAVPKVKRDFGVLDRAYEGREWLAGDTFSLADIFMAPIVSTVAMFPEGKEVLEGCKNLKRAFNAIESPRRVQSGPAAQAHPVAIPRELQDTEPAQLFALAMCSMSHQLPVPHQQ